MVFGDDEGKKEFSTFEECFNEKIAPKSGSPPNELYKLAMNNYKK